MALYSKKKYLSSLLVAAQFAGANALAVDAGRQAQSTLEEIVVTARKREESDISVPVAISAVGSEELNRRAINNLNALSNAVPNLRIGPTPGSVQGSTITIRGQGASADNPLADQSVSFNIDGVQVARSTVTRMALMDIEQIEVLKGPQALFFGKNSPGGIISIRTADPTDTFEARLTGSYEVNAEEWRGDGYVSAPLTDTLGVRLAMYGSAMEGWSKNLAANDYPDISREVPNDDEYGFRATVKFDPSEVFDARFKLAYNSMDGSGIAANDQWVSCVTPGVTQYGDPNKCRPGNRTYRANFGPEYSMLDPSFGSGKPFYEQEQWLSSLELNYQLTDSLTLTSVTGYYDLNYDSADNFTYTGVPQLILTARNKFAVQELSQELRLASDFQGPLNFIIGGYYQESDLSYISPTGFGLFGAPMLLFQPNLSQDGESWSAFGQVIYDISENIELAVGGRYSYEEKSVDVTNFGLPFQPPVSDKDWNDFSPEATIAWRPSSDLTFYASYKRGFLSGGFNGGPLGPDDTRDFDQQVIRGYETGVKARLLEGTLRTSFTLYSYEATGLQVTTTNTTPEGGVSQTTMNAGKATLEGMEFEVDWLTPVDGLSLSAAIAYSHARYDKFVNNCYVGQSIAQGCNQRMDPVTGAYTQQDFAGRPIIRSPDWTGGLGFVYDVPLHNGMRIQVTGDAAFSDEQYTAATASPGSYQDSYWVYDASLRLLPDDESWEVALVGVNLSEEYYFLGSFEALFAGGPTGLATPGTPADMIGGVSRGRQIYLRASRKF